MKNDAKRLDALINGLITLGLAYIVWSVSHTYTVFEKQIQKHSEEIKNIQQVLAKDEGRREGANP